MKNPQEQLRLETVDDLKQVNYWLKKSNISSVEHEDVFTGLIEEHRNEHYEHSAYKLVAKEPESGLLRDCVIVDDMKLSRAKWHLFDDWFKVYFPVGQAVSTRAQAIGLARSESVGMIGVSVGAGSSIPMGSEHLSRIASVVWFRDEADAVNFEMNLRHKIKWLKTV